MKIDQHQAKTPRTLRIRIIPHLASQLSLGQTELIALAENAEHYYREFNREVKGKPRELVMAVNPLALTQRKILDRILLRLPISDYAYGAIKGRSILDNAKKHARANFVAKFDIKSFYPSIRSKSIYDYFIAQECISDVARILTLLTTRKYSLPLGVSTSPMLADQIIQPLDKRIAGMAKKAKLNYSRYVDDITISGNYPIEQFTNLVLKIIRQNGYQAKRSKLELYRPQDGKERIICGVRVQNGKISAPKNYIQTLRENLLRAQIQSQHQNVRNRSGNPTLLNFCDM